MLASSNTTPARYDVTASAIIKPKKHQRRADQFLQSGALTHKNRVQCAIKSTRKSIWQNCWYLGRDPEPELPLKWPSLRS